MPTHAYRAAILVAIAVATACGRDRIVTTPTPTPIVVPDVRIAGFIGDTAARPIGGVTVEAVGAVAGASTMTDANGQFTLTGSFRVGTIFRAHADGFQPATQTLTFIDKGEAYVSILLPLDEPPVVITPGEYEVRFAVPPPCDVLDVARVIPPGTQVPEELLQSASYSATLTPVSPYQYTVELHAPASGVFTLGVAGHYVRVGDEWVIGAEHPDLNYLSFNGDAHAIVDDVSPASFTLDFVSVVTYCRLSSPMVQHRGCYLTPVDQIVERSFCSSPHHEIRFTRR